MANEKTAATRRAQARDRNDEPTHLLGRSRRDRFRRAGIQFVSKWQAWPLADLDPEAVKRVLEETGEIDSRLCTADEAAEYTDGRTSDDDKVSKIQLRQALDQQTIEIGVLRADNVALRAQLSADRPPVSGQGAPGSSPPLAVPEQQRTQAQRVDQERTRATEEQQAAKPTGPTGGAPLPPVKQS